MRFENNFHVLSDPEFRQNLERVSRECGEPESRVCGMYEMYCRDAEQVVLGLGVRLRGSYSAWKYVLTVPYYAPYSGSSLFKSYCFQY